MYFDEDVGDLILFANIFSCLSNSVFSLMADGMSDTLSLEMDRLFSFLPEPINSLDTDRCLNKWVNG